MDAYRAMLERELVGATVLESGFAPRVRANVPYQEIGETLQGKRIVGVTRSGKEIFFAFDSGDVLSVHLMLTGRFNVDPAGDDAPETRRASFVLDNGKALHVRDRRGLATLRLNPEPVTAPDALSDEVDAAYLQSAFDQSPGTNVKAFLVGQDHIRGIGNGYSDEILWAARIAPQSTVGKIPPDAVAALAGAIHEVLGDAVALVAKLDDPSDYRAARKRDMKVHNDTRVESPTGAKIQTSEVAKKKTFFTDEQVLYA